MSEFLLFLLVTAIVIVVTITVCLKQKKPSRIMREGKLLRSETVNLEGEPFYVEKVAFKDWHVCIHAFYLVSDGLTEGQTIVEQRWSYEDFCNVTVRLEDYTYTLFRQVDVIAFVRSFRPIPIDRFDSITQPLII